MLRGRGSRARIPVQHTVLPGPRARRSGRPEPLCPRPPHRLGAGGSEPRRAAGAAGRCVGPPPGEVGPWGLRSPRAPRSPARRPRGPSLLPAAAEGETRGLDHQARLTCWAGRPAGRSSGRLPLGPCMSSAAAGAAAGAAATPPKVRFEKPAARRGRGGRQPPSGPYQVGPRGEGRGGLPAAGRTRGGARSGERPRSRERGAGAAGGLKAATGVWAGPRPEWAGRRGERPTPRGLCWWRARRVPGAERVLPASRCGRALGRLADPRGSRCLWPGPSAHGQVGRGHSVSPAAEMPLAFHRCFLSPRSCSVIADPPPHTPKWSVLLAKTSFLKVVYSFLAKYFLVTPSPPSHLGSSSKVMAE